MKLFDFENGTKLTSQSRNETYVYFTLECDASNEAQYLTQFDDQVGLATMYLRAFDVISCIVII